MERTVDNKTFVEREKERARRLSEFVKGELRNMYVEARFDFTVDLFNYLLPEIRSLLTSKQIEPPTPF